MVSKLLGRPFDLPEACSYALLGDIKTVFSIRLILSHCWGKTLLNTLLSAHELWGFPLWLVKGEKWVMEHEMVGWHHWLNGYESEQTPGVSEGQRSLACCSLWGCKRVGCDLATEQQPFRHQFHGRPFFPQKNGIWRDGFRMIHAHYIYCSLYF